MTTVNQQLLSMPVPERIGYDFDGWYTEKEGGTHVTVSSRIYSGDETLYAHWIDNGRPEYAQSPVITVQPENAQYSAGDPASPLTVQAGVTDGGTLFYQWYRSADGSTTGGTKVGTNSPSFTPDTSAEGTYYYYCVITNTNDAAYYPTATVTTDAACIKVTKAHSHTPVPVVGREATCTEAGSRAYYICGCGMAFEDEGCTKAIADVESWRVIPLLGHSFGEWETVTEATCTQTGKEKRTCSRCEAEETRETEMKAHTWSDSYLGENADPEKHYHVCEICGTRDNGAEHVWNVDAATEQTDRHCTVCGYVAEAQVGHTHKGTLIAGKDATCTEAGSKAYYTCTCGKFFEDEACTKAIADLNGWITIPASGHDFEDGKCVICGAADPDYEPAEPSESTGSGGNVSEGPQTGDSNSLVLWAAVLFVSGGVLVALAVKRKRQKE